MYFEEWDHPRISTITWVSELIEICGGQNIFKNKSGAMARDREVTDEEIVAKNPDVIFGCWCGKKVKVESFSERPGFKQVNAVRNNQVFELAPEIYLQPGPALFVDGLDQMLGILKKTANLD